MFEILVRTASSPKFKPKNKKDAADATAYDNVATMEMARCANRSDVWIEGKPIKKKASPKNSHGKERI